MNLNLVVRVLSFFSLPDGGPKSWQQGRILPTQVVDMHSFNVLQLVNFIAEHFMWGSKQYITLWRALEDTFSGDSIEIKTDEQLLEWFELNKTRKMSTLMPKLMILRVLCSFHQQNVDATLV